MHRILAVFCVAMATCSALMVGIAGRGDCTGTELVARSRGRVGGRNRVMALRTLPIVGWRELLTSMAAGTSPEIPGAPEMAEGTRRPATINLERRRTRVQQRLKMDFVFASTTGQLGLNRTDETLDDDIAYNVGGGFRQRRRRERRGRSPRRRRPPDSAGWSCWPIRLPSCAPRSNPRASSRTCGSKGVCSSSTSRFVKATR